MGILNEQRVWLDEQFRAKIDGPLMNNGSDVGVKVEERCEVVKGIAPLFNHDVMTGKATPKTNPMIGNRPIPGSYEFVVPFAELLRRFDFICETLKIDVPEEQRDDIYVELCRQFYTNLVNLEIQPTKSRVGSHLANLYPNRANGVLLYGDSYAVGEQVYSKATLRKVVGGEAWNAQKYLNSDKAQKVEPYVLQPIEFNA